MATREDRIAKVKDQPNDSLFLIRRQDGQMWKHNDRGYTDYVMEAKMFSKEQIITKLEANGLMDKTIETFISKQII
jgi:hypothetical protein